MRGAARAVGLLRAYGRRRCERKDKNRSLTGAGPAVGREGPGRAEQRHVVVLLGVVDAEADRHVPQEGLGRRRHALRREVLSNAKGPLVGARAEVRTFKAGPSRRPSAFVVKA